MLARLKHEANFSSDAVLVRVRDLDRHLAALGPGRRRCLRLANEHGPMQALSTGSHGVVGLTQIPTYSSAAAKRLQKMAQAVGVEMAEEQPHGAMSIRFCDFWSQQQDLCWRTLPGISELCVSVQHVRPLQRYVELRGMAGRQTIISVLVLDPERRHADGLLLHVFPRQLAHAACSLVHDMTEAIETFMLRHLERVLCRGPVHRMEPAHP
mmetsp:Transcript_51064/g.119703  ORF Transcript_51064/g.119703 Transcript_51064/m.119703 type:complete len:210 (+) Transcript_51064:972-1601(+)